MHTIEQLSTDELSLLALAMDYYLCNGELGHTDPKDAEDLLIYLDLMAEQAESMTLDNLLIVDFSPKSG
jgi:hypothetical protein